MKITATIVTLLLIGMLPVAAQSFNFRLGMEVPTLDSGLWNYNEKFLTFDKDKMKGLYMGLEFEHFMSEYASLYAEIGHYEKDQTVEEKELTYLDGSPIVQNTELRITSLEAGVKLYPLRLRKGFNPYIGAGVGLYKWSLTEYGDFVDGDYLIHQDVELSDKGTSFGFHGKAGMVYRFHRSWGVSFEGRYRYLKSEMTSIDYNQFDKLDLRGFTFSFGVSYFLK